MLIKGQTPDIVRRPASVLSQPETKPAARAPWTPNDHQTVFTECGHVTGDDMEIAAIGAILRRFKGVKVYCRKCDRWVKPIRKATALDFLGLTKLPYPDDPPF